MFSTTYTHENGEPTSYWHYFGDTAEGDNVWTHGDVTIVEVSGMSFFSRNGTVQVMGVRFSTALTLPALVVALVECADENERKATFLRLVRENLTN